MGDDTVPVSLLWQNGINKSYEFFECDLMSQMKTRRTEQYALSFSKENVQQHSLED